MSAYYNENDSYAAQWLRNLIGAGHIAPGDVDERSIVDVRADDLAGYEQCHFFAGIGIWSAALRNTGWPDTRAVWTGSCPCQPLSQAGQRKGHADERHLWPAFHGLIAECRPAKVFGEQVASPDGQEWLSAVRADLEATGYAVGAADLCAAGACVGFGESAEGAATLEWIRGALLHCPDPLLADALRDFASWAGAELGYGPSHIRQRLYWMADAQCKRRERGGASETSGRHPFAAVERFRDAGPMANTDGRDASTEGLQRSWQHGQRTQDGGTGARSDCAGDLGDAAGGRCGEFGGEVVARDRRHADGADAGLSGVAQGDANDARSQGRRERGDSPDERAARPPSLVGSDWIVCTDGKARPTLPGVFPLVNDWSGPSRVACLRAAGNAIKKELAAEFIAAATEAITSHSTQRSGR